MSDIVECDVPPGNWAEFCERWGETHRGWLVTIKEVEGEAMARDRPLRGVQLGKERALLISLDGHSPCTLDIAQVTGITERFSDGAHAGLKVERASKPPVLISFRVAALPEMLDGLAEEER